MTSYHSVDITSNIETITKAIGEPIYYAPNDTDEKVQVEWEVKLPNGNEVYLYAWKEYRPLNETTYIDFHIGARDKAESIEARKYINSAIVKSRK